MRQSVAKIVPCRNAQLAADMAAGVFKFGLKLE
jgi:hypothetical protein